MAKMYRIIARIAELRHEPGKSPCQLYKLGQEFDLSKPEEKEKICRWAFNAMFPFLTVLQFGGTFPWETEPGHAYIACPDPNNVVVFELRRAGEIKAK